MTVKVSCVVGNKNVAFRNLTYILQGDPKVLSSPSLNSNINEVMSHIHHVLARMYMIMCPYCCKQPLFQTVGAHVSHLK